MPSIAMSTGSGAVSSSAAADRLHDAAPVGVAAVQRGLDQRRVGDRARHRLDAAPVAAAHDDAPDALGALAVADDVQRELAQQRVERLAEAQLVLGLRRDATPLAPEAIRITVSLVESWPSTVMRSNERLTHTPSSRSAVSGASAASVCTKQSIVAKFGCDHPGALGLRAEAHRPRRQLHLERGALLERVGGHDRLGEVGVAVGAQLAAAREQRPHDLLAVERHADHAGRGRPRRGPRSTPAAIAAAPCIRAASSSPGRPVAALALPELTATARRRVRAARAPCVTITGAASMPERVKRAALTASGRVADEQADVARAARP